MLELDLNRLKPGRGRLDLDDELVGSADGVPDCRVLGSLHVDNMDQKILIHGEFGVVRSLKCDRCSKGFEQSYQAEIEVMVLRSQGRGRIRTTDEDAWVVSQQRGNVSLADPLREAAVLHEPQQVICRDDCRGLCVQCGIDLNVDSCDCETEEVDPRWAALKRLRDEAP